MGSCKNCGNEVNDVDKFCKSCGRRLTEDVQQPTEKETVSKVDIRPNEKPSSKNIFYILAIAGTIFLAIYFASPETRLLSRQVSYQEPEYGTVYSGTIGEYHLLGNTEYSIQKATEWTKTYTGGGTWGDEYTFHICWNTSCTDYYKIQFWNLQPETAMIGYSTKYRTEYYQETKSRIDWWFGQ